MTSSLNVSFVIPEDLVHYIFSHSGDLSNIKCCSLVCRAWQRIARTRIFASIEIVIDDPTRDLKAFNTFLKSQPSVASCVLCVHIISLAGLMFGQDSPALGNGTECLPQLSTVLRRMERLRSLYLDTIHLPPWPAHLPLPSPVRALDKLSVLSPMMARHDVNPWEPITCLLNMFTSVRTLSMTTEKERFLSPLLPNSPVVHSSLIRITSLELGLPTLDEIHLLIQSIPMDHLEELRLRKVKYEGDQNADVFGQCERCIQAATNITTLLLEMPNANPGTIQRSLSLHSCNKLENVELTFICNFTPTSPSVDIIPVNNNWRNMVSILRTLRRSCPLSRLRLTAKIPLSPYLLFYVSQRLGQRLNPDVVDWDALERALEPLSALRKVEVVLYWGEVGNPREEADKAWRTMFKTGIERLRAGRPYTVELLGTV